MDYKVFSTYYQLSIDEANLDLLPPVKCIVEGHNGLIPLLTENNSVELYCVQCPYTLKPGLELYSELKSKLEVYNVRTQGK
jgi:hypothetical protein